MSFVLGVGLILPLVLVRDRLYVPFERKFPSSFPELEAARTIMLTLCYEGLLVGFWFIDHAYVFTLVYGQAPRILSQLNY